MEGNRGNGKIKVLLILCALIIIAAIFVKTIIPDVIEKNNKGAENINEETGSEAEQAYISYDEVYALAGAVSNGLMEKPEDGAAIFTCGDFHRLLTKMCEYLEVPYEEIVDKLPKRLEKVSAKDGLYVSEFFEIYMLFTEAAGITEEEIFLLAVKSGMETDETEAASEKAGADGELSEGAVTEDGKASEKAGEDSEKTGTDGEATGKGGAAGEDSEETPENEVWYNEVVMTDSLGKAYIFKEVRDYSDVYSIGILEKYADERFVNPSDCVHNAYRCLVKDGRVICILEKSHKEYVLHNVWAVLGEEKEISFFAYGFNDTIGCKYALDGKLENVIADITVCDSEVTAVTAKPGRISGRVLRVEADYVELENYGKLEFDEFVQIYKIYDKLEQKNTSSLLTGYSNAEFTVVNGRVCAALITSDIEINTIRVLINSEGFKSKFHEKVTVTADSSFSVTQEGEKTNYSKGEKVTFEYKDVADGRIVITPANGGKIIIKSFKRSYGEPAYRGVIELAESGGKIVIVNELPIEEYLYAVIPSEMPSSYNSEALKVQAICARSYAVSQLMANKYAKYGANVDDSTSSQVYNNIEECSESINAVDGTAGIILTYDNEPAQIYYFSTSVGHTADVTDVWENGVSTKYLTGKFQSADGVKADFSDEEQFRAFIDGRMVRINYNGIEISEEEPETFDSGYAMYRWSVNIKKSDLKERLDECLSGGYSFGSSGLYILSGKAAVNEAAVIENEVYGTDKVSAGEADTDKASGNEAGSHKTSENDVIYYDGYVFEKSDGSVTTLGKIEEVHVAERGSSGIATKLYIKGSSHSAIICLQYNIRSVLAPLNSKVVRSNGSTTSMSLLPSAFMYIDDAGSEIAIKGGGYGHGLGMSQNGANTMAKLGYSYEEILKHYFEGTEQIRLY